ncbi:hypothetical protein GI364_18195 [Alicyclobacillus sp. SO9]|nr:hypothetical protein GI364_18195 [Alicyclobacillus sp. SO9]
MAGSRRRGCIKSSGEKIQLIIRRMRCEGCKRIHHELPNLLVPYKRYEAESIEQVVTQEAPAVGADESTLRRIRTWFEIWSVYATRCLASIAHRMEFPVENGSNPLQFSLQSIGQAESHQNNGWLGKVVRPIVNMNLWVQTRSAFLSE